MAGRLVVDGSEPSPPSCFPSFSSLVFDFIKFVISIIIITIIINIFFSR